MIEPTAARIRPARRMMHIPFSPIRQVFEEVGRLQAQGKDIINLAIGRPDFDTPELIKDRAVEALRSGRVHYTSNYGIPELRQAVAAFESERLGIELSDEQIIVTVGANEAVFLVMMAYADPGDEVLIPSPSWYHYDYCATLAGANVVHYPLRQERGFVPDPRDVESRLTERTRILVINTPHNPTGTVVPRHVIREIVALARAHGVLVLSDEVYSQLVYAGYRHASPLEVAEKEEGAGGEVVLVSGMSKAYSMTGWRLGYAVAAREVLRNLVKVHQYTVTCATSFCQEGAVVAFTPAGAAEVVRMRQAFQRRRDLVVDAIRTIPGWQAVEPGGAFYVFINVAKRALGRSQDPGSEVANRLLHEVGVAVVPGSAFSADTAEYIRISYASSYDNLEEAFRRIRKVY